MDIDSEENESNSDSVMKQSDSHQKEMVQDELDSIQNESDSAQIEPDSIENESDLIQDESELEELEELEVIDDTEEDFIESKGNWVEAVAFQKMVNSEIAASGTVNGQIFIWNFVHKVTKIQL